jgi:hypothetical protein
VLARGATTRSFYLPAGRWVDLWRSARVADNGALRLGRARTLRGSRELTVPAPLEELPLMARAGAILPLLPPDVDSLTSYGRARGLVHLRDRARRLRLVAFPRGRSRAEIGPGEQVRSVETKRGWRLAIRGRRVRRYSIEASLTTLRRPFRPCGAGRGRRWRFDPVTRVLRATMRGRSPTLRVRRCAA